MKIVYMKKLKMLYVALGGIFLSILMSHSVWIEIDNQGKVGKEAKVKLYFGEIRHGGAMKGLQWYDGEIFKSFVANVKEQGSKENKSLKLIPSEQMVSAVFTPEKPGIYQITAYNETGTIKDYTRHGLGLLKDSLYLRTTFEATAFRERQAGKIDLKPMMTYDIVPFPAKNGYGDYDRHQSTWRVNEKVYGTFYIKGKPAIKKEVKIYSPDGWISISKTNENGLFSFLPYKAGTYQAIYETKRAMTGTHKGKKYNTTRVKVITNMNIK